MGMFIESWMYLYIKCIMGFVYSYVYIYCIMGLFIERGM